MQNTKRKRLIYFIGIPLTLLILLFTFLTAFEYTAVAEIRESFTSVDQTKTLAYGKVLFETRGCSSCHAIKPRQKSLGPNLFDLSSRKSIDYIRQSIASPDSVIVPGYDDVVMPNFGEILDTRQIEALVAYVQEIK